MSNLHIGILCAMPEEIGSTIKNLKNLSEKSFGDLKIFSGDKPKISDHRRGSFLLATDPTSTLCVYAHQTE